MRIAMLAENASSARTPIMWRAAIEKLRLQATFEVQDFAASSYEVFIEFVKLHNYDAIVLGHPNKIFAVNLILHPHNLALKAGINLAILRQNEWQGFNFDGIAFLKSLLEEFPTIFSDSIFLLLGNGSTANACHAELTRIVDSNSVRIIPRSNYSSASYSINTIFDKPSSSPQDKKITLVNCTPMGKSGVEILPTVTKIVRDLSPNLIYDLNYYLDGLSPWKKAFGNIDFIDGRRMNLIQAALGFHQLFLNDVMSQTETISFFESL